MAKWKLFNRSKSNKETGKEKEFSLEPPIDTGEKQTIPKMRDEHKERPITEYNETLYSKGSVHKQPSAPLSDRKQMVRRKSWENPETIEQNIDNMRRKQIEPAETYSRLKEDVDKKVDFILLKKKGRQ